MTDDLRGEVLRRMEELANHEGLMWADEAVNIAVALAQEKVAEERKARGHVAGCLCVVPLSDGVRLPEPIKSFETAHHTDPRCAQPDKQGGGCE